MENYVFYTLFCCTIMIFVDFEQCIVKTDYGYDLVADICMHCQLKKNSLKLPKLGNFESISFQQDQSCLFTDTMLILHTYTSNMSEVPYGILALLCDGCHGNQEP